jgi:hypothetical protein
MAIILDKETGKIIGRYGLLPWTIEGQQEVEVAKPLAQDGFEKLNNPRLICMIDPENIASQKVAEKFGMTLERKVDGYSRP